MASRPTGFPTAAAAAMLVLAANLFDTHAGAQQTTARATSLTRTMAQAAPRTAPSLDPWERRTRLVSLNPGALPSRVVPGAAAADASQLSIDLFDGASITAAFERFDPNAAGVTWVGTVPGQPGSQVTIVQGGGLMAASIILPGGSYTIRPVPIDPENPVAAGAEPIHVLSEINSEGFKREAEPLVPAISADTLEVAADEIGFADTAEFIDVLVVYTAKAENWAGGPAGIFNWITLGMSETNSAYASSGVNQRVRLANAERVAYNEVGSFETNLANLRAGAIGLETVAARRNSYTADLVTMFVRPSEPASACGIGYIMTNVSTAFAPNGFSVVDSPCSSPNGTLAHEFGHNMGLRHDWYMDSGVTPFTYAHGYVNLTARFRTIMAYPNACTAGGVVCTRLLSFSNPDLTFQGQPMGVHGGTSTACPTSNIQNMACDADERRALNNSALAVANFREFSTVRPPTITANPQSQTVTRGQTLNLQVVATGLGPFTYQWYRGAAPTTGQPIPGATGSSLTIVPGADGVWFERWFYWAQVTNSIGSASSLTATVTMVQPGADVGAPSRLISGRAAAPNPRQGSGAGPFARARTPVAAPAVAASTEIVQVQPIAGARPIPKWPLSEDQQEICRGATADAILEWLSIARSPSDAVTVGSSLTALLRVLAAVEELACRDGGSAPRP